MLYGLMGNPQYLLYTVCNAGAAVNFLCLMISVLVSPANDQKLRYLLSLTAFLGMAVSLLNCGSAMIAFADISMTATVIVVFSSFVSTSVFELCKAAFIYHYSGGEGRICRGLKHTTYCIWGLLSAVLLIKPLAEKIFYFPAGSQFVAYGPWYTGYIAVYIFALLLPMPYLILMYKKMPIQSFLFLCILQGIPFFTFLVLKDETTFSMFFWVGSADGFLFFHLSGTDPAVFAAGK